MTETANVIAELDVYDVLGLDRDDPTHTLLEEVQFLRAHWEPRVDRSGATGEAARESLQAISVAEKVFADGPSREAYDRRLRGESELVTLDSADEGDLAPDVDFYDVLGLDRTEPAEVLLAALASQKATWLRRAGREGAVGEQARQLVDQIEDAEAVFATDMSRTSYDRRLVTGKDSSIRDEGPALQPLADVSLNAEPTLQLVGDATPILSPSSRLEGDAASGSTVVNLYDVLGLDRGDTTEAIRMQISDQLKPNWQNRAMRAGRVGEEARASLEYLAQAELVFASEDTREIYDRELRRRPELKSEDERIDWLRISWNYYFRSDMGAAAVASRKAREQSPDDALPYVITAWVELAQDEVKRAKMNADEAYVLDELGEDTVDVQHVRGAVYANLEQYERALESFDRALAKASPGETPEIFLRKAWVFEKTKDIQGMLANCVRGLSVDVELTASLRRLLEDTCRTAIARKCLVEASGNSLMTKGDAMQSVDRYNETRTGMLASPVREPSKSVLIQFIDARIELARRLAGLEERRRALSLIEGAKGAKPDFPLMPLGAAVVLLLMTALHVIFLFASVVCFIWVARTLSKSSEWESQKSAHERAIVELQSVVDKLRELRYEEQLALTRG